MSLKENCRNRIFSIVSKITEKSKYVIMIVDGNAYRVLSFVCKNEELLERGVSLIELINTNRSSLKDFDCIYFLSSNIQSVDFMLKDFPNEKEAKYNNVHILFTSAVGKNSKIIELIAHNDCILKKIKSCASINMDFLAYESRSFYFERVTNLYDLFPLKNTECLFEISSKLISVCSCLNITRPFIRYQNSNLCRKFAEIFYNGICNTFINNNNNNNNNNCNNKYNKNNTDTNKMTKSKEMNYGQIDETNKQKKDGGNGSNGGGVGNSSNSSSSSNSDDLVLILDRSIDCSTLFIHEYSYQSLCYDLLKIKTNSENWEQSHFKCINNNNNNNSSSNINYNNNSNIHNSNMNNNNNNSNNNNNNNNTSTNFINRTLTTAASGRIGRGMDEGEDKEEIEEEEEHTCIFEITNNEQKKEHKKTILSEDDSLWMKYRHLHIQDVNEMVKHEITSFSEKNAVAKLQKKNILNPAEALAALRSLPQYESMIEKYWLHVYLCNSCFKLLQRKNIVEAGLIEQDLCCNVDKSGKELSFNKNTASVNNIMNNEEYGQEEKARILLLYFVNYVNINEYDKMKTIESAQLGLFMQKIINQFLQLKIHCNNIYVDPSLFTSSKVHHILDKQKEKIKNYKHIAKKAKYELSRHEPNIKDIILQIYNNSLNKSHFHFVDVNYKTGNADNILKWNDKKIGLGLGIGGSMFDGISTGGSGGEHRQNVSRGTVWDFNTSGKKLKKNEKRKKLLIFIIGGITFPEIKCVYELSDKLHMDIYIGGTSILTSSNIFSQFKKRNAF